MNYKEKLIIYSVVYAIIAFVAVVMNREVLKKNIKHSIFVIVGLFVVVILFMFIL